MNWISPQTLGGSFSSVSKPIFASKYAFCSIFRDLQDLQTFAPLQIQDLQTVALLQFSSQKLQNLSRLVLCCIEAKFCNQILIFQRFSGSTRQTHFCTAPISKFCKNSAKLFAEKCKKCPIFSSISSFFAPILMKFDRNFTGFLEMRQFISTFAAIRWNFDKLRENLPNVDKILKISDRI